MILHLAATETASTPWAEYGLLGLVLGAGFILLYRHGSEMLKVLGTLVQRLSAIEVTAANHSLAIQEVKIAADKVEAKVDAQGLQLATIGATAARALEHTQGNLRQMCLGNIEEIKLLDHRVTVIEAIVHAPSPPKKSDG